MSAIISLTLMLLLLAHGFAMEGEQQEVVTVKKPKIPTQVYKDRLDSFKKLAAWVRGEGGYINANLTLKNFPDTSVGLGVNGYIDPYAPDAGTLMWIPNHLPLKVKFVSDFMERLKSKHGISDESVPGLYHPEPIIRTASYYATVLMKHKRQSDMYYYPHIRAFPRACGAPWCFPIKDAEVLVGDRDSENPLARSIVLLKHHMMRFFRKIVVPYAELQGWLSKEDVLEDLEDPFDLDAEPVMGKFVEDVDFYWNQEHCAAEPLDAQARQFKEEYDEDGEEFAQCPSTHPYAYSQFGEQQAYCCKHQEEKVDMGISGPAPCDGGMLSFDSRCCLDDAFVPCSRPPCGNYAQANTLCDGELRGGIKRIVVLWREWAWLASMAMTRVIPNVGLCPLYDFINNSEDHPRFKPKRVPHMLTKEKGYTLNPYKMYYAYDEILLDLWQHGRNEDDKRNRHLYHYNFLDNRYETRTSFRMYWRPKTSLQRKVMRFLMSKQSNLNANTKNIRAKIVKEDGKDTLEIVIHFIEDMYPSYTMSVFRILNVNDRDEFESCVKSWSKIVYNHEGSVIVSPANELEAYTHLWWTLRDLTMMGDNTTFREDIRTIKKLDKLIEKVGTDPKKGKSIADHQYARARAEHQKRMYTMRVQYKLLFKRQLKKIRREWGRYADLISFVDFDPAQNIDGPSTDVILSRRSDDNDLGDDYDDYFY